VEVAEKGAAWEVISRFRFWFLSLHGNSRLAGKEFGSLEGVVGYREM